MNKQLNEVVNMNDKQFDDFLRQQLQHSSDYLDDGDFSAKVMASLPAPKRLNPWLEKLIILLPVSLIAVLVLSQFSLREFIQPAYAWLLTLDLQTLVLMAAVVLVLMFVVPLLLIVKPRSIF
ncbi:MAG TPA: hypothetical protein VLF09_15820 [Cellvibrio sp.]|nr:hypothetical protein [Cellvibrio sp.]